MPYVLVRESFINSYCSVEGLPLNEGKILGERCGVYPDTKDEKSRKLEFSTSVINILNSLEQMNYKVLTSGSFVASQSFNNNKASRTRFSQKDFIWTLHRVTKDFE